MDDVSDGELMIGLKLVSKYLEGSPGNDYAEQTCEEKRMILLGKVDSFPVLCGGFYLVLEGTI